VVESMEVSVVLCVCVCSGWVVYVSVCCVVFVCDCVCVVSRLRSYGVMVSTLDSESSDPGSNPGRTSLLPKRARSHTTHTTSHTTSYCILHTAYCTPSLSPSLILLFPLTLLHNTHTLLLIHASTLTNPVAETDRQTNVCVCVCPSEGREECARVDVFARDGSGVWFC
jgi:hypothetical protein